MPRTTTKLGYDLRIGDRVVYGETLLGRLKVARVTEIQPANQTSLRVTLQGAGAMSVERSGRCRVLA